MNDEEKRRCADRSKSDPTFLLACRFVTLRQSIGIIENQSSGLEADIVPQQVFPILVLVPFKTHGRDPA